MVENITNGPNDPMLYFLNKHIEHITTVRRWDEYADKHGFPSSYILIQKYGSWNNLKQMLGVRVTNNKKHSEMELLNIARVHKIHFTSKRLWSEYARDNGLPVAETYIKVFGSWNKVKDKLELEHISTARPPEYTKEDIINILKVHGNNLINRSQWDVYAKENNLPTYKTVRKHFSAWEEVLTYAGRYKKGPSQ